MPGRRYLHDLLPNTQSQMSFSYWQHFSCVVFAGGIKCFLCNSIDKEPLETLSLFSPILSHELYPFDLVLYPFAATNLSYDYDYMLSATSCDISLFPLRFLVTTLDHTSKIFPTSHVF